MTMEDYTAGIIERIPENLPSVKTSLVAQTFTSIGDFDSALKALVAVTTPPQQPSLTTTPTDTVMATISYIQGQTRFVLDCASTAHIFAHKDMFTKPLPAQAFKRHQLRK